MILRNRWFEASIQIVILFNFVVVLMETELGAQCWQQTSSCVPIWIAVMNYLLLAIYTLEASARCYAYRWNALKNKWTVFDITIVVFGYIDLILTELVDSDLIPNANMLRVARVARLLRSARLLRFLPELHSMVRGFMHAMSAMLMGFVGILALLVFWAVIAVNFVHPVNMSLVHENSDEYCHRAFESMFRAIILLFQGLVAGDSWGRCAIPIVLEAPMTFIIFAGSLITIQLGFTNLILASIVERGAEARAADREAQASAKVARKRQAEAHLRDICEDLDTDEDGLLTLQELLQGYTDNEHFKSCMVMLDISQEEMTDFFSVMDADNSGEVSYEEFIAYIHRAGSNDVRNQLMYMEMQMNEMMKRLGNLGHLENPMDGSLTSGGESEKQAPDHARKDLSPDSKTYQYSLQQPGSTGAKFHPGLSKDAMVRGWEPPKAKTGSKSRAAAASKDSTRDLPHSVEGASLAEELRALQERIAAELAGLALRAQKLAPLRMSSGHHLADSRRAEPERWQNPELFWGVRHDDDQETSELEPSLWTSHDPSTTSRQETQEPDPGPEPPSAASPRCDGKEFGNIIRHGVRS